MEKHRALEKLVDITNSNLGFAPASPSEFNELSISIKQKTGRTISLSSIKRLWGYVRYEGFPTITTLNILAQFNGFKDWETFLFNNSGNADGEESGFLKNVVINTADLNQGDRFLLRWGEEKLCEIECIASKRFRVNSSQNIKILPGDEFTIHSIALGLPLYLTDIRRGDLNIPAYIGARPDGVASITPLPQ